MGMSGDTALTLAKNYVKKTLQGQGALKGQDGFSPIVTENKDNTDEIYKLDITTKDGTFTTPNLRGKDGEGSGGGEANVIESISVNGTHISVDENKNVDITVPSIDGLAKTEDIPTKVSELTNDSGYLTEHQDISGKVDKVEGKSLISDTEIARLAAVDNYDDTDIKAEIAKKADTTSIPSKVSVLENDSKYQTESDVTTTLSDYATKTYVGEQIANSEHLKREIVTVLPSDTEAGDNIIYMLKVESATGNDKYQEYMKIDGTVQMVGDTSVDLTDYAKTTEIPTTVAELSDSGDYAKTSDVNDSISALQTDKADASDLTAHTDDADIHVTAENKATWNTVSDKVDKEEGKGLSSNDYTSEEKTRLVGVGTSQGRNLIPYPLTDRTTNGITYTVQSDGSVVANGTASAENNAYYNFAYKTLKLGDTSYTLSCEGLPKSVYVYVYDETISKAVANVSDVPVAKTFVGDSTHIYSLSINVGKGISVSDLAIKPILEMGTIAHAYEPISESNVNLKAEIDKISTAQGKNLISYPYTSKEGTGNGITWTVNDDGTITADGTATNNSFFNLTNYIVGTWDTLHAGTYTIMDGVNLPIGGVTLQIESTSGTQYKNKTFTIEQDVVYKIFIYIPKGTVADNITFKPMLEVGSIAHMYEPTTESNISLKSAIDGKADKSEVCVNMLNPTLQTSTSKGITCTNNGDSTFTFNGTATVEPNEE